MDGEIPRLRLLRNERGMARVLHVVPGTDDVANGMVMVARLLAKEQVDADVNLSRIV